MLKSIVEAAAASSMTLLVNESYRGLALSAIRFVSKRMTYLFNH